MPQLLRFILVIAVLAAIGVGVYYWVAEEEGVDEVELDGTVEELEQP